jgi:glutathione S-transferase
MLNPRLTRLEKRGRRDHYNRLIQLAVDAAAQGIMYPLQVAARAVGLTQRALMKLTTLEAVLIAPGGGAVEKVRQVFRYYQLPFQDTVIPASAPSLQLKYSATNTKTLTQPWAMVRVVARLGTGSLFPLRLEADIEEWLAAVQELEKRWYPCVLAEERPELLAYSEAPLKNIREAFVRDELPKHLSVFEQQLATGGPFLLRTCTVADLCLQPLLVEIVAAEFVREPLAAFPSLKKWMDLVAAEVERQDDVGAQTPLASQTANPGDGEGEESPGADAAESPGVRWPWQKKTQAEEGEGGDDITNSPDQDRFAEDASFPERDPPNTE